MTFKINGTALSLQPTEPRWSPRERIDLDGNGRPVYVGVREYELRWGAMSGSEFRELQNMYMMSSTGVVVVALPVYADPEWKFGNYSGVRIHEPEYANNWNEHYMDVTLLITNINTEQAVGAA